MTAVEWFSNKAYELFEQYSEGKFDRIELNKLMLETTNKAKEMDKEKIEKAFDDGVEEGIMRSLSEEYNIEYYVNADRYYNETFKSE